MNTAIDLRTQELSSAGRVVAVGGDGKRAIAGDGQVIRFVGGRALMSAAGVVGVGVLDGAVWIVTETRGEHALHRFDNAGLPMGPATALGALGADVTLEVTRLGLRSALIEGERGVYVREQEDGLTVDDLGKGGRDRRVLMGGRGVMERRGAVVFFRAGRGVPLVLPRELVAGRVVGGAMVFDGVGAMIEIEVAGVRTALVYELGRGTLRSRARLGDGRILAVAERHGMLVLGRGANVVLLDLRAGCCVGERVFGSAAVAGAIDADGKRLLVIDGEGGVCEVMAGIALWVNGEREGVQNENTVATGSDVVSGAGSVAVEAGSGVGSDAGSATEDRTGPVPARARAVTGHLSVVSVTECTATVSAEPKGEDGATADRGEAVAGNACAATTDRVPADRDARDAATVNGAPAATNHDDAAMAAATNRDAATDRAAAKDGEPVASATALDGELAEAAELELAALGPAPRGGLSDDELDEYLGDARAWVTSLCRTALAAAWARRPGGDGVETGDGDRERQAAESLAGARAHERGAAERFERWSRRGVPHVEVARELGLSPIATTVLLVVAAPQIWGELARVYGACVADPARPLVDELLLAHLLEADATSVRTAIGRELDDDAALVKTGAVEMGPGLRPYAAVRVHPAIARRLAGAAPATDPAMGDHADRTLAEIMGPREAIAGLALRLSLPASGPVRVVLRGRTGAGRRTLAAALAAQAGRGLAVVTIDGTGELEGKLRQRLRDVTLRGDLPCVAIDGLAEDPAVRARIRGVLDAHGGPVFVRAPRAGELPLAPGYHVVDFAPLTETERRTAWERTLAGHDLDVAPASALATRFAVGPGAMEKACRAMGGPVDALETDALEAALAAALRQHRSARIEAIATRVEQLASWDDLIVPDDISDALRELCARVHHRRTVLEDWGLRDIATTARGVTALFQGGPGTGKTMAAEVVARALGYELWRVDLSKVVSKWIGETEKNLAAVFDAAEDGEIVLLFDEADSLFGKRTEVKSSNDRNANLETNYLLQRLDTFTGIAILTTNFGTAIDPAFRRRLSVQAEFPFPDELDRERLWRAHLPRKVPVSGDLDLAALARRFQLTGGYIRNAVLRAAYLAASRGTPLTAADLERAVRAEYLARGKVSATGALN